MKAERSPEPAHPIDHRIARGMQILRCLLIRTAAKYRSENPVIERITAGKEPPEAGQEPHFLIMVKVSVRHRYRGRRALPLRGVAYGRSAGGIDQAAVQAQKGMHGGIVLRIKIPEQAHRLFTEAGKIQKKKRKGISGKFPQPRAARREQRLITVRAVMLAGNP